MKIKLLLILNTLSFIITLFFNYISSTGIISGKSVGEVSDKYNSLITPASYAFSIWGLIYVMLFGFIFFQWYSTYKLKDDKLITDISIWFIVSNLSNALWLVAWVNEAIFLSVIFISILLFSLVKLVFGLRLEVWDAPLKTMFFVWWPITFYFGWVLLATVVNLTSFLVSLNLGIDSGIEELLAVIVLVTAGLIYYLLIQKRNLREAALVGIWGLIAIAANQYNINNIITYTSIILALLLLSVSGRHAYNNRETTPINKLKRKEF